MAIKKHTTTDEKLKIAEHQMQQFKDMEVQQVSDMRVGLSTRQVCKIDQGLYEIHSFVGGWQIAVVTQPTLWELLIGKEQLINLEWE